MIDSIWKTFNEHWKLVNLKGSSVMSAGCRHIYGLGLSIHPLKVVGWIHSPSPSNHRGSVEWEVGGGNEQTFFSWLSGWCSYSGSY